VRVLDGRRRGRWERQRPGESRGREGVRSLNSLRLGPHSTRLLSSPTLDSIGTGDISELFRLMPGLSSKFMDSVPRLQLRVRGPPFARKELRLLSADSIGVQPSKVALDLIGAKRKEVTTGRVVLEKRVFSLCTFQMLSQRYVILKQGVGP
jgi:hypothetical protein